MREKVEIIDFFTRELQINRSISLYCSPRILERLLLQLPSRSNTAQEIEQPFCVILPAGASALLPELIDPDVEHSGDEVQLNHNAW